MRGLLGNMKRIGLSRQIVLASGVCAALIALDVYLAIRHRTAAQELARRSESANQVAVDTATIAAKSSASKLAAADTLAQPTIQTAVEFALANVGIPVDRLLRTSPLPSRTAPEGQPQEHAFRLTLTRVSMEQLVLFCARMLENEPVLRLRSLQLRSVENTAWQLDATFAWMR